MRSLATLLVAGVLVAMACFLVRLAPASTAWAAPTQGPSDAGIASAPDHSCSLSVAGAVAANGDCRVRQEYEQVQGDAGLPFVTIHELPFAGTRSGRPASRIVFHLFGQPTVGVQSRATVVGVAQVQRGTDVWEATAYPPPEGSMGAFSVTLTSVRMIRVRGTQAYDLHGTVDAELLPTVEGTASGVVKLHASF